MAPESASPASSVPPAPPALASTPAAPPAPAVPPLPPAPAGQIPAGSVTWLTPPHEWQSGSSARSVPVASQDEPVELNPVSRSPVPDPSSAVFERSEPPLDQLATNA